MIRNFARIAIIAVLGLLLWKIQSETGYWTTVGIGFLIIGFLFLLGTLENLRKITREILTLTKETRNEKSQRMH